MLVSGRVHNKDFCWHPPWDHHHFNRPPHRNPPGGFEGGFLWNMAPSLCPTSMLRVAAAVGTCASSYVIEKRCNGENDRWQEMKIEGQRCWAAKNGCFMGVLGFLFLVVKWICNCDLWGALSWFAPLLPGGEWKQWKGGQGEWTCKPWEPGIQSSSVQGWLFLRFFFPPNNFGWSRVAFK